MLIQCLKYDAKRKILEVRFTDKNIICYSGVEPDVYRAFENTSDKDAFYLKNIISPTAECFSYF